MTIMGTMAAAKALPSAWIIMLLCNSTISAQCFLSETSAVSLLPTELLNFHINYDHKIKIRQANLKDLKERILLPVQKLFKSVPITLCQGMVEQAYQMNALTYFEEYTELPSFDIALNLVIPTGAEFCVSVSRFQVHHLYNLSRCASMLQFIFHQTVSVIKKNSDQILMALNNILSLSKAKVYFNFNYNVIRANIFYTQMHENEQKTLNMLKFLENVAHTYSARTKRDLWGWLTSPDLSDFTSNLNENMRAVNTNFDKTFKHEQKII